MIRKMLLATEAFVQGRGNVVDISITSAATSIAC